jgi:hypothetical protein
VIGGALGGRVNARTFGRVNPLLDERHTPTLCLNAAAWSQAMARARFGDTEPANPIPKLPGTRLYKLFESIFRSQAPKQHA